MSLGANASEISHRNVCYGGPQSERYSAESGVGSRVLDVSYT